MKSAGYFITGTDTGVGKTTVTASFLNALRGRGLNAMPMKPVQTGCVASDQGWIAPDLNFCLRFAGIDPDQETRAHLCPYRFPLPASPHLAAMQDHTHIHIDALMSHVKWLISRHDVLLVEGAGGVLVPLNETELMLDFMKRLAWPVLVAARPGLGTINHTLLTLRVLRDAGLTVAGVVFVSTGPESDALIEEDNIRIIEKFGSVPVLGRIPYLPMLAKGHIDDEEKKLAQEWMAFCR